MEQTKIQINTGESYVSDKPAVLDTLLGSCVGVCLFDPVNRVGGMSHILLPTKHNLQEFDDSTRYGINAMELLINLIMKQGGNRSNLVAKVYGGAKLSSQSEPQNDEGSKNTEFVLEFLKKENIRLESHDIGGIYTRNVNFKTDTGEAEISRKGPLKNSKVLIQELKRLQEIRKQMRKAGTVTLFEDMT